MEDKPINENNGGGGGCYDVNEDGVLLKMLEISKRIMKENEECYKNLANR